MKSPFPKNFLWGASTASHQVEGGTHNQWTEWEKANSKRLTRTAFRRLGKLAMWAEIKYRARRSSNYVSGRGVDHYHRYEQDLDLLLKINLNAFRFGIEWARLEPEEGVWNQHEIEHYHRYIQAIKRRGIEPVMNIWHWTLPVWFAEKGGFKNKDNLYYFDRMVQKITDEYGQYLKYIIVLNEPNVYTGSSYLTGEWPPQEKSVISFVKVYLNLVKAQKRSYAIIKAKYPRMKVGLAAQLANIQAKRPHHVIDQITTKWMRYYWNWWFLNKTIKAQDFIGINYYFTDYFAGFWRKNPKFPVNDLGWYMEPEGLYPLLRRTWIRYRKPIIVTENGLADRHDQWRQWWLEQSIVAMERAMSEGVQIQGYMHWSLMDNFEWSTGWWPEFGLIHVDRNNSLKRSIRPSARWLARKIASFRAPEKK